MKKKLVVLLLCFFPLFVNASNNLTISCEKTSLLVDETTKCKIIANSDYGVTGVSGIIKLSNALGLVSIEHNTDFQGGANNGVISLYTDSSHAKSGSFVVVKNFVIKAKSISNNETITEITNFDSGKVVGLYAKTKAEAAKYVIDAIKNKNLNACIIHPSGIIGPNDYGNSHLTQLVKEVANGKLFACVKGGYDFVDVRDVADGIISACDKNNRGECYILSNKYITIKELTDFVCDLEEKKRIKIVLPLWLAELVAPICELYYNIKKQTPLFTKYSLYTLSSNSNFSNEKAKKELEYKNRNMKDTIKDTIKWLKKMNYIK